MERQRSMALTRSEFEMLLALLRKFHLTSGENILDMEVKIENFAKSTPLFKVREGVFMDEKMAYAYDMEHYEDKVERAMDRERRER